MQECGSFFICHIATTIITDDPEEEETTHFRLTCSNRRPLGGIGYCTALRKAAALIQSVNIRVMSRVSGWDNSGIIHVNLCIHKVQLRRVAMHANEADGGRKKKKRKKKTLWPVVRSSVENTGVWHSSLTRPLRSGGDGGGQHRKLMRALLQLNSIAWWLMEA